MNVACLGKIFNVFKLDLQFRLLLLAASVVTLELICCLTGKVLEEVVDFTSTLKRRGNKMDEMKGKYSG